MAVLLALGAGLAACGGGGGDGGGSATVDLTLANRDAVAHSTAASLLVLGSSTALPVLASPGGIAQRETPLSASIAGQAAWTPRIPARVLGVIAQTVRAVGSPRESPMAVITNPPQACGVSGTATVTLNDANGDGVPSVGEAVTVAFNQCQDTAAEVLNGSVAVTITATSPTSFSATLSMSQLSDNATNGRHSMTLSGTLNLSYTQLTSTTDHTVVTASGPVTATIHTHLPYDDTLTLQSGYVQDSRYDATAGRLLSTLTGTIQSANAGGAFSVATDAQISSLDADAYPSAGLVRMTGRKGVMLLTAQSASQVKIDLDAEGDGAYESSRTDTWDWLL
jgi:hypothetical protein